MWTAADRDRYRRDGLRYPSDLTDAEWALIAPLIRPAKRGGRRRSVVVREVMNGLLYVLETGCQWRHLPRDLPPRSTVHSYLQRWDWDGTLEAVHHRRARASASRPSATQVLAAGPPPASARRRRIGTQVRGSPIVGGLELSKSKRTTVRVPLTPPASPAVSSAATRGAKARFAASSFRNRPG